LSVSAELRLLLAKRDKNRCVYCLTSEENCGLRMHVDHIIPVIAGGETTYDNLCLACFSCNIHKGANQKWVDPTTLETVSLFHPLRYKWNEHFSWNETKTEIIGLTPCGRATIAALQMNNSTVVKARHRWVSAGWHPPV